jgi:hypothetical protein
MTPSAINTASDRHNAMALRRWQLWVDRGGGYDVLQGQCFSIGGAASSKLADIAVRSPWGRHVATLWRGPGGDLLCLDRGGAAAVATPLGSDQELKFSVDGSLNEPRLRYQRPCPLSGTAVLTVLPPHRLLGPTDGVILLDQTLLVGPEPFNHVRVAALSSQGWVLFQRQQQWWVRGAGVPPQEIGADGRWQYEDWSMTIREVLVDEK